MGKFNFIETGIKDLYVIEPTVFGDNRGYFMETYNDEFKPYIKHLDGTPAEFVQDNHSKSKKGVLRGLHFQKKNHPIADCPLPRRSTRTDLQSLHSRKKSHTRAPGKAALCFQNPVGHAHSPNAKSSAAIRVSAPRVDPACSLWPCAHPKSALRLNSHFFLFSLSIRPIITNPTPFCNPRRSHFPPSVKTRRAAPKCGGTTRFVYRRVSI